MKKLFLLLIFFNIRSDERDDYVKQLYIACVENRLENKILNKDIIKFLVKKLTIDELIKLNNLLLEKINERNIN